MTCSMVVVEIFKPAFKWFLDAVQKNTLGLLLVAWNDIVISIAVHFGTSAIKGQCWLNDASDWLNDLQPINKVQKDMLVLRDNCDLY